MNKLEKTIRKIGKEFSNIQVSTPIVVGGWAINLLGMARQTLDFDFMILEDEFAVVKKILEELNYKLTAKTSMFVRFESEDKNQYAVFDCLFADKNTYNKLLEAGKKIKIFDAEFILPDPMHIIAMKMHALKYGDNERKTRDILDIKSLIRIYGIDTSEKSDFEKLCLKYGTAKILKEIIPQSK